MRKTLFGVFITLLVLLAYNAWVDKKGEDVLLTANTALIREQLKNVGKLVVTEGHFSEVFTYENSKAIFGDYLKAEKRAIVIVNADVTVGYDLSLVEYDIDEASKTLRILSIPEEEIKISTDYEYYDTQADFFNQFEAKDYNKIKAILNNSLQTKIEASDLKSNAQNRLLSELSKFYILTNSLGWTLTYNENPIRSAEALQDLKL